MKLVLPTAFAAVALVLTGCVRQAPYVFAAEFPAAVATCEVDPEPGVTLTEAERQPLDRARIRCTRHSECLARCIAGACAKNIGGGCWHVCGSESLTDLYVVDGVPYEEDGPAIRSLHLDPEQVTEVRYLAADSTLLALYGRAARYGVMVIRTNRRARPERGGSGDGRPTRSTKAAARHSIR
jgi:hypothetical protein